MYIYAYIHLFVHLYVLIPILCRYSRTPKPAATINLALLSIRSLVVEDGAEVGAEDEVESV